MGLFGERRDDVHREAPHPFVPILILRNRKIRVDAADELDAVRFASFDHSVAQIVYEHRTAELLRHPALPVPILFLSRQSNVWIGIGQAQIQIERTALDRREHLDFVSPGEQIGIDRFDPVTLCAERDDVMFFVRVRADVREEEIRIHPVDEGLIQVPGDFVVCV